jgi:hypothetical protein
VVALRCGAGHKVPAGGIVILGEYILLAPALWIGAASSVPLIRGLSPMSHLIRAARLGRFLSGEAPIIRQKAVTG